jgi:hypothetical protein
LEERVLHLVDGAEPLRRFSFHGQILFQLLGVHVLRGVDQHALPVLRRAFVVQD